MAKMMAVGLLLACLVAAAWAIEDGIVRVSLQKNALDLQNIRQQRQEAQENALQGPKVQFNCSSRSADVL